jgi:hypothetical protein
MTDYGMKIARDGCSIDSNDLRDFVIHSKYKTFKANERVTTTLTLPANTLSATKTIAHNLGYKPFFFANAEFNSGKWYSIHAINSIVIDENTNYAYLPTAYVDNTNLYITITRPTIYIGSNPFTVDRTYNISYYIVIDDI